MYTFWINLVEKIPETKTGCLVQEIKKKYISNRKNYYKKIQLDKLPT